MSRTRSGRFDPDEPPATGTASQDNEPDPESVARAIALRKLGAAPQTRAQLAEAMARKNVPEEIAEKVLDRFEDVNLIDDAAYAEMLVRSRHNERGLARRALSHELRRKGIDPEVAAQALEQIDDDDELTAARDLAERRARATRGLDPVKRRRRLAGMLARKGYSPGVAMRAVDEALAGEEEVDLAE